MRQGAIYNYEKQESLQFLFFFPHPGRCRHMWSAWNIYHISHDQLKVKILFYEGMTLRFRICASSIIFMIGDIFLVLSIANQSRKVIGPCVCCQMLIPRPDNSSFKICKNRAPGPNKNLMFKACWQLPTKRTNKNGPGAHSKKSALLNEGNARTLYKKKKKGTLYKKTVPCIRKKGTRYKKKKYLV